MNNRVLISLIAALAAGGAGGYLLGRRGAEEPRAETVKVVTVPVKKTAPGVLALGSPGMTALREVVGDGPLTAENASARVERALAEPDELRRQAAVSMLLLSMDAGNARAVMKGFQDVTINSGRTNDAAWAAMMKRFGQLLGVEGIKEVAAAKLNAHTALEGLAASDPDAAWAVLEELGPENLEMRMAWMKGLAQKDPTRAFSLIVSGKEPISASGGVMNIAIQSLGLDGVGTVLKNVMASGDFDKESLDRFQRLFDPLADSMFYQHWHAGTVDKMLNWLEQQKGGPQITGPILAHGLKDGILSGKPAEALEWLARMVEGSDGSQPGGHEVQRMFQGDPKMLSELSPQNFERALTLMPQNAVSLFQLAQSIQNVDADKAARIVTLANSKLGPDEFPLQLPPK